MKVAVISFSKTGYALGARIAEGLSREDYDVVEYTKSRYTRQHSPCIVEEPVGVWTGRMFPQVDALVYIGACGIAVRSIAPYVKDKKKDPAVVVADEGGKHVIALLSGHIGGANKLASAIAETICGQAVITTATDIQGRFAVDVFAKENGCYISNMEYAKEISAALLGGEPVGFYSDFPWTGELPRGLLPYEARAQERPKLGIALTSGFLPHPYERTLYLIPRVVTLGIGCRKGTHQSVIEAVVRKVCNEFLIPSVAMEQAATIDIKKDEPGLTAYCTQREIPLVAFSKEELLQVEGTFTSSDFVLETVGVDNVCERSAMGACPDGEIIRRKYAERGVTVALVMKKWRVCFE